MTLSKTMSADIEILVRQFLIKISKKKFLKLLKEIIMADDPSLRTQSHRYSQAKLIAKKRISSEKFLKEIRPDDKITKEVIKLDLESIKKKQITTISGDQLQTIMRFKNSYKPDELALYLMLISGRRLKEICESKFKTKKLTKNKILIHGVAKRRDAKQFFEIELIDNKTSFFKSLKDLKKGIKNKKYGSFQKSVMRKMKKVLRHEFHPHMLRRVYAVYLFQFRNRNNISMNAFIQNVLTHQSISASVHYTNIKFDFNSDILGVKKYKKKNSRI